MSGSRSKRSSFSFSHQFGLELHSDPFVCDDDIMSAKLFCTQHICCIALQKWMESRYDTQYGKWYKKESNLFGK